MKPQDLITHLRDIHYPQAISTWPLAFGWYILLASIILILVTVGYLLYNRWTKHALKRVVLTRIDELEKKQAHLLPIAEELSALLRRAALACYPRRRVAGLYAQSWLAFLDKTGKTTEFSEGIGKLLIVCPYQDKSDELPQALFHLIKSWVKKNL